MTGSVTFSTSVGGDGSTVTDDDNATTGLRNGGWRTRFVPCFTNQVAVASFVVTQATNAASSASSASTSATNAATSASSASTYASNASSSASSASTSATNAASSASSAASSAATVAASFSSPPAFGNTTPNTGAFTTLSASSTVSGVGFSNYLASPPAIGGTAAAAGSFTTLSASSTVTFSGGTANGVVYLNGSKVATSGSALTFDGSTQFLTAANTAGRGQLSINGGSGGFSQISFYRGPTTNTDRLGSIYAGDGTTTTFGYDVANSGYHQWLINSSEQMRLNSTGLGIGTTSPATKLQITSIGKGTIFGSTTPLNFYSAWQYNSTDVGYIGNGASIVSGAGLTDFGVSAFTGGKMWLGSNNGASYVVLDASGNLGLGVTPSAWVSMKGYQVNAASFVGDSPLGYRARVIANAYFTNSQYKYQNSSGAGMYTIDGNTSQHQWLIAPAWNGTGSDVVTFTQAMTLDASGNLLVGMTSTSTTARGSYISNVGQWFGQQPGNGTAAAYFRNSDNGSIVGSIVVNSTSTSFNTSSDQRLKTNIVNAPDASLIIDSIKVRSFDWLADGSHQRYGMVAQELLEVAPEAVCVPTDDDEMMGVDYSKLVPMLVKEIQSLRARVANLEK